MILRFDSLRIMLGNGFFTVLGITMWLAVHVGSVSSLKALEYKFSLYTCWIISRLKSR